MNTNESMHSETKPNPKLQLPKLI